MRLCAGPTTLSLKKKVQPVTETATNDQVSLWDGPPECEGQKEVSIMAVDVLIAKYETKIGFWNI